MVRSDSLIELNKCYCIDNLELMKQIPDNYIDLIYCDILYGTGRKFDDFQDLEPQRDIIEEFYIPRIQEMHRILKNTGSIYLHMDWRINHWIRCIMDDIFGYKNLQNEIIWSYRSGGAAKTRWNRKHDTILFYTKGNDYTFHIIKEKSYMSHKYGFKGIDEFYDEKEDKWYRMVFPRDVWDIPVLIGANPKKVDYTTQKPKALLERIIKASSNKGDIVADFFCGSGTAGVVAKELGRDYILCDINPKAIEISEKRLDQVK
jgi:DNA modification methylase